ncbi:GvpL/GvpF family gas vesicle protein [Streptomyces pactum]|uniref:GvpL/GvpF family gas vesicle protein n=1 Tax=Streptomyces pactum TaxID=68249 RepID=A0ABS0NSL3_9ACTN|nr:GvpL/GvpF family gas vesicle protein [Streptomyces pactum]MBH5338185.1 GvpL/GvpF family gas vesicle protein [Streptomyces pactum]
MKTYVYGIVPGGQPPLPDRLEGVGDPPRPVRGVRAGELTALVSDCPEGIRPRRRDLMAHQRVLTEVGKVCTVLPMRFGSVSPDESQVREVLTARAADYRDRLRRLDGRSEYNVKAVHHEQVLLRQLLDEEPGLREMAAANRSAGGGSYESRLQTGERVARAVQDREKVDAELVTEALTPLAEEHRPGPESGGWFVNLSLLVPREGGAAVAEAVDRLRREHPRLDLRLNGPLPPYSFVEP